MKKIYLVVPVIVVILLCLMFISRIEPINAIDVKVVITDHSENISKDIIVEDYIFVDKINRIVADQFYIKQPFHNTYSRLYVDYEIFLLDGDSDDGTVKNSYRIILNPDQDGRLSDRSRIDVEQFEVNRISQSQKYTLLLTADQELALLNLVRQYDKQ